MRKFSSDVVRALFGLRHTWPYKRVAQASSRDVGARLADAFRWVREADIPCSDAPVFIFSAGWRAGSTLLQRMIMQNNKDIVIWGEPFHLSNIFDNMLSQFRCFTERYPRDEYFLSRRTGKGLSDQWVANLYPDVEDLVSAHRKFFQTLFSDPALKVGATRWGIKVVRPSIDHAIYLRAMFPQCKIIFTCRDPLDAYASFRKVHDAFFLRWPDSLVATPYAFGVRLPTGHSWADRTASLRRLHSILKDLPNSTRMQVIDTWKHHYVNELTHGASLHSQPISWPQISEMAASGIFFGSHTVTHPNLTRLSNDDLQRELAESKNVLEDKLQKSVDTIAYPIGTPSAFNAEVISAVRKHNFKLGLTYVSGANPFPIRNPLELHRHGIGLRMTSAYFRALTNLPSWLN